MSEFQTVAGTIHRAICPEEIFGGAGDLAKTYKMLLKVVHPDRNGDTAEAQAATQELNELFAAAEARVGDGTWGKRLPMPGRGPLTIGSCGVDRKATRGDVADVYVSSDNVVLKVARSPDDADLLRAERVALNHLASKLRGPVKAGVPELVATFKVAGNAGWDRDVNVLSRQTGFVTAEKVRELKGPLDGRTIAWMFKRLLKLLEQVHAAGYIHGAILPPHVMFYPDNDGSKLIDPRKHALRLVDWCYAVKFKERTRLSAWVPRWEMAYPPEIIGKKSLGPTSDIYMAAKLIFYLQGGSVEPMPAAFGMILDRCTHPEPAKRYQSAGAVFVDWTEAVKQVYGEPKWHPFEFPKEA